MFKALVVITAATLSMAVYSQTDQRIGNTTFGSNGSSASTIGNSTFINPPNGRTITCNCFGQVMACN